jgi:hypothetical protein
VKLFITRRIEYFLLIDAISQAITEFEIYCIYILDARHDRASAARSWLPHARRSGQRAHEEPPRPAMTPYFKILIFARGFLILLF